MKKVVLLLLVLMGATGVSFAAHLKGGWIQYTYIGPGTAANTSVYRITVRQYLDPTSTAGQRDADVSVAIYNNSTNALVANLRIALTNSSYPSKTYRSIQAGHRNGIINYPYPNSILVLAMTKVGCNIIIRGHKRLHKRIFFSGYYLA